MNNSKTMTIDINYDKKRFFAISRSLNQALDNKTIYRFHQRQELIWGNYKGGGIKLGLLIGKINNDGSLELRYQHLNDDGEIRIGKCRSVPEQTADGRIRLKEFWAWIDDEAAEGVREIEEITMM